MDFKLSFKTCIYPKYNLERYSLNRIRDSLFKDSFINNSDRYSLFRFSKFNDGNHRSLSDISICNKIICLVLYTGNIWSYEEMKELDVEDTSLEECLDTYKFDVRRKLKHSKAHSLDTINVMALNINVDQFSFSAFKKHYSCDDKVHNTIIEYQIIGYSQNIYLEKKYIY